MTTESYFRFEAEAYSTLREMLGDALSYTPESSYEDFEVLQPLTLRQRITGKRPERKMQRGIRLYTDLYGPMTYVVVTEEGEVPGIAIRSGLIREPNRFKVYRLDYYVRDYIVDHFGFPERMARRHYRNVLLAVAELLPESYPFERFIPEGFPPSHPHYARRAPSTELSA